MDENSIQLVALAETRHQGTSKYVVGDTLYIMSSSKQEGEREYAGVGVALNRKVRSRLTQVHPVSSRLLLFGIREAARELVVIVAYAPHAGHELQERQDFFDELVELVEAFSGPRPLLVLGDMNARIYHSLPGEEGAFGPHPLFAGRAGRGIPCAQDLRDPSSNRGLLLACCRDQQLQAISIYYSKPDTKKATYRAPGAPVLGNTLRLNPAYYADLDHCLVAARWRGLITDVCSDVRANIQTDHFPLKIRLKLRLGSRGN
eukprot:14714856-Alexandrium_andersonii.AAC.1